MSKAVADVTEASLRSELLAKLGVKNVGVYDLRREGEVERLCEAALTGGETIISRSGRCYGVKVAKGRAGKARNWPDCTITAPMDYDEATSPLRAVL